MTSMRIADVIGNIVSATNPRTIVSTYEGHAWERLAFSSARKAAKNYPLKCIGYQQAALFRLQHASKRLLGKKYDPDVILTAGEVGLKQLRNSGLNDHVILNILGSKRSITRIQNKPSNTCIVLPEGILSECEILFSFSLKCARENPEVKFIWRLHPIISFKDIDRVGIKLNKLPNNVSISKKSLEQDLRNCKWALYRGSTAIITAGANGIIPIYLSKPDELTINPLYEIADSHETVTCVDTFKMALSKNKWDSKSEKYCKKFYTRINLSRLAELL